MFEGTGKTSNFMKSNKFFEAFVVFEIMTLALSLCTGDGIGFVDLMRMFFGIVLFVVLGRKLKKQQESLELERRERKTESIYNEAFIDMIREIRIKQHGFDNQINAISNLYLNASNLEELSEMTKDYRKSILEDNKYNKMFNDKSSPMIIGFLYNKFKSAESMGICVNHHVVIGDARCSMPRYQIVEIIGVLMDNAVEAVQDNKSDRRINFEMIEFSDRISIKVMNVFKHISREQISKFFKEGYTTKGNGRGNGLYAIKTRIENAKNYISAENIKDDGLNWFCVSVEISK